MAYPNDPTYKDFVNYPRATSVQIENEEQSIEIGTITYFLDEVPDGEKAISCTGDVGGVYTFIKTILDNPSPDAGEVYVNTRTSVATHNTLDAPDDLTWDYWGLGTSNNAGMQNQYQTPINDNAQAAMAFRVEATDPVSQTVTVRNGNTHINGKLAMLDGGEDGLTVVDVSAETFSNPGYHKKLNILIFDDSSTGYLPGPESATQNGCIDPPTDPTAKILATVFFQQGQNITDALIVNTPDDVGTGDGGGGGDGGGDGGSGNTLKMQYTAGVVPGDTAYVVSATTVDKADADDDSAVPAIGCVEAILDDTYCTVKLPGTTIDFTGKTTTPGSMTPGAKYYLSINAGCITATQNKVPGQWDQEIGIALTTSILSITCGAATKNEEGGDGGDEDGDKDGDGKQPVIGKYRYTAGVIEKEFVFGRLDIVNEAIKVTEAKANSLSTLPAIGIVHEIIDATWCTVKNNYHWKTAEHGGLTPGGLTPGAAGNKFWISVTSAGAVQSIAAAAPDLYIQVACIQVDADGTDFLICCGDVTTVGHFDPPGNTYDCDASVGEEDAVYFKYEGSPVAPKAYQAKADDDTTMNAVGIAINVASNRCVIKFPGESFESQSTHPAGGYYLSPWTAGAWTILSGIIYPPGSWKKHIALCDGSNTVWVSIDEGKKQGGGEDAEDGDDGSEEIPGQIVGTFWSSTNIATAAGVDMDIISTWCALSSYSNDQKLLGVCLSSTLNDNYVEGENGEYIIKVLMGGFYKNTGLIFITGGDYFITTNFGNYGPAVSFQHRIKYLGHAVDTHTIHVMPENRGYLAPGGGDPVPATDFVSIAASLSPHPEPTWFEKIRGNDETAAPGDGTTQIDDEWVSEKIVCEDYTVISNIDFAIESAGEGSGAYVECDLVTGPGVSILSSVCELVTTGDGVEGDTIPNSANNSGHTRAVVKNGLMPLVPGTTLYVKREPKGIHTTAPYGLMWVFNKYLVKEPT